MLISLNRDLKKVKHVSWSPINLGIELIYLVLLFGCTGILAYLIKRKHNQLHPKKLSNRKKELKN